MGMSKEPTPPPHVAEIIKRVGHTEMLQPGDTAAILGWRASLEPEDAPDPRSDTGSQSTT
jgi:hypothetical protein